MLSWMDKAAMIDANLFCSSILDEYQKDKEGFLSRIAANKNLNCIQLHAAVPDELFLIINEMLKRKPNTYFRIFNFCGKLEMVYSNLRKMNYLQKLYFEVNAPDKDYQPDMSVLTEIPSLRELFLNVFNLKDYSYIRNLPPQLECLMIYADTYSCGINFDCEWLLRFKNLRSLYLAKKARKNIEAISRLPKLEKLCLHGIKLPSLDFLKPLGLKSFSLNWCAMNDLSSLGNLITLEELELFRIIKLEDISFISKLTKLKRITLDQLRHVETLPDLTDLKDLQEIKLLDMKIDTNSLPPEIRKKINTCVR